MTMLEIVDAHQHFWDAQVFDYGWTGMGQPSLDRSFLPGDLKSHLEANRIARTVTVQVLQSLDETRWLLALARGHPTIAGVVGWVDLTAPPGEIAGVVEDLRRNDPLVGIRHLVQDEPDDDWLLQEPVVRGLGVLEALDVPFDLLIRERHLRCVPRLSERLPSLRMVIDHAAKPRVREKVMEPWRSDLTAASANPRIWCKISGLVTEADPSWTPSDLAPYVEAAMAAFGSERLMFGSDWPVCTLAGSYHEVLAALRETLGSMSPATEARIFGGSAIEFYGLS